MLRSLRARLVVALLALLLAVGAVVGVVTAVALNAFLLQQLDGRLMISRDRLAGALPPPGQLGTPDQRGAPEPGAPDQPGPPGQLPAEPGQPAQLVPHPPDSGVLDPRGLPPQTVGARIVDGQVVAALVDRGGTLRELSTADRATLASVPVDQRPHTVALELGSYRLLAVRDPDGAVLVAGLPLAEVQDTVERLVVIELIVIGSALVLAGIAGAMLVRRSLRPLARVATTAGQVAELPSDRGEVALAQRVPPADADPRTEVGQVGLALNRMLGHVAAALESRQASETRLRQFVADASHELRTPLAAIRGYTELSQRRSAEVPAEVEHALSRVASATERMTTLVEDLLLLARLDAGRPLAVEQVDLSALVVGAVSDAHAAGPDHVWRLTAPDQPVLVTGDTERLAQVVANLLANARRHTPAGTTVTITLAPGPDDVRLVVADDGLGIPTELLPHVFERFARGDGGRARSATDTASTGLGLSIVDAVVAAHGGTVQVDSQPGRTSFSVKLPRSASDAQP